MTDPQQNVRALLDQLGARYAAATPGKWKLWGMSVMADQDGTSNVNTAVPVANTCYRDEYGKPRTFDASLICEMQRSLPMITAALRAVLDLADEIEDEERSYHYENRCSHPYGIEYIPGVSDEKSVAARRIRAAVVAALGAEEGR